MGRHFDVSEDPARFFHSGKEALSDLTSASLGVSLLPLFQARRLITLFACDSGNRSYSAAVSLLRAACLASSSARSFRCGTRSGDWRRDLEAALPEILDDAKCDSDEGGEFASHISTPSDSYLTLPDDVLVEKRLEEIFIDNELHEDSPQIPAVTASPITAIKWLDTRSNCTHNSSPASRYYICEEDTEKWFSTRGIVPESHSRLHTEYGRGGQWDCPPSLAEGPGVRSRRHPDPLDPDERGGGEVGNPERSRDQNRNEYETKSKGIKGGTAIENRERQQLTTRAGQGSCREEVSHRSRDLVVARCTRWRNSF
ncbi:hypothetical protein EVAR_34076_1 [Eumeta japonica]|uniref:Uncharacterized protein n=1 Tax=Eumeta variegata TaxID=151549 RepID=A0A4C1WJ80_EUMVA|nr:hypothetical protein EVAR_34076_1 [Eumeta japonica]